MELGALLIPILIVLSGAIAIAGNAVGRNIGRRRLSLLIRLLRGRHEDAPEVRTFRGAAFRLRFAQPPAYETDGEWNRARSAELQIETLPGALQVLVPSGA